MLASSTLQAIICTSCIGEAEKFYSRILGLPLQGKSHGALIYDVGGSDLRVSPVPATQPSAHTVLGFAVPNLRAIVELLRQRGVSLERFAGFAHDSTGILTTPEGAKVAWFRGSGWQSLVDGAVRVMSAGQRVRKDSSVCRYLFGSS